jgi:hypothetical protein
MRRHARHLFTILSAASMLLCVAVCVLWVRSYFTGDRLIYLRVWHAGATPCSDMHELLLGRGIVCYNFLFQDDFDIRRGVMGAWGPAFRYKALEPQEPDPQFSDDDDPRFGFRFQHFINPQTFSRPNPRPLSEGYLVILPMWLFVVLFGALPAVRCVRQLRQRRRRLAGRCTRCGYDLRASPERCPECGNSTGSE